MLVPDYIEPLIGWRSWQVQEVDGLLELRSLYYSQRWAPGHPAKATCHGNGGHPVPSPPGECGPHGCGIYATKTPEGACAYVRKWVGAKAPNYVARRDPGRPCRIVLGRVKLWGDVETYSQGYRAEYAEPELLLVPSIFGFRSWNALEAAVQLADRYCCGVELVSGFSAGELRGAVL